MNEVRIGAIGYGYWGPNVVRNLAELPDTRVVTICDASPQRLEAALRRYPSARGTREVQEVLDDPTIDAVYVATPVSTHYALTKAALLCGKHVLVEKPLAMTSAQGLELCELAEARGLVLMVGHTFVYSPPVRKVRELLQAGTIGELYYVETTRVNLGLFQKDVSVIWDLAPHDLSILNFWLGSNPTNVSARGRSFVNDSTEDVAFLTLEYPNHVMAQLHVSWLAPSKLRRTTLVGSQRMIVYDDLEPTEKVRIFDRGVDRVRVPETFGEFQLTYRSGDIISPALENTEPLQVECQHFVECILAGQRPQTDGEAGLAIVLALEAAERSLKRGGALEEVVVPPLNGRVRYTRAEGSAEPSKSA